MKTICTALFATLIAVTPALAAENYSFGHGNNYSWMFQGPDGDFSIDEVPYVKACDGDSRNTFFRTLDRAQDYVVQLQTYTCGEYIKVCIDPVTDDESFEPQSCGTFVWERWTY